jgi:type II secretory pathway pseudopilin PulG
MSLSMALIRGRGSSASLIYGAPPRVNLLPPAERERRERAELIRRWGAIAIAIAVLIVLAVLVATLMARSARNDLRAEQVRTTELAGELAAYGDVSATTRDKSSYEAYRTQVMASDITWKSALGALQAALPAGASISGFDALVGDQNATAGTTGTSGTTADGADATVAAQNAPSGTAVTLSVQVTSNKSVDQRAMVASFAKVHGVLGVDMTGLSSASGTGYSSTTSVYFDRSVLSGRYARAAQ